MIDGYWGFTDFYLKQPHLMDCQFSWSEEMNCKTFCQRFNRELSLLGFPEDVNERKDAVHKVFNVTRHLANAMIFGHVLPAQDELNKIALVLEVCPQWLSGATDKRKAYPGKESAESV